MARVRKFVQVSGHSRVHPTEVDCQVSEVTDSSGTVAYLQLSTLGSDGRKSGPKSSQTIQLDQISARALRSMLDRFLDGAT